MTAPNKPNGKRTKRAEQKRAVRPLIQPSLPVEAEMAVGHWLSRAPARRAIRLSKRAARGESRG